MKRDPSRQPDPAPPPFPRRERVLIVIILAVYFGFLLGLAGGVYICNSISCS